MVCIAVCGGLHGAVGGKQGSQQKGRWSTAHPISDKQSEAEMGGMVGALYLQDLV